MAFHQPTYGANMSPVPKYLQSGVPQVAPVSPYSSSSVSSMGSEGSSVHKSNMDVYREEVAGARALSLLKEAFAGVAMEKPEPVGGMTTQTTRQAASQRYDERCMDMAQLKARLKVQKEHARFLGPPKRKEAMASSSRPRKPKTAEDVRDPETVAGMKCQMDIDREDAAKKKALRYLNEGFM
jgi:hypothetical protein